ncbi:MAG: cytidine deaminase [Bacillota bacterium]|nr:cytidine deaminase [Bacillota bacterium]
MMYSPKELIERALDASKNAYAPYSHFKVGAALLAESGNIYTGCNIENASYGATICAERAAIAHAVGEGERHFTVIAVVCESRTRLFPCGICRQTLSEFGEMDVVVEGEQSFEVFKLSELIPLSFQAEDIITIKDGKCLNQDL